MHFLLADGVSENVNKERTGKIDHHAQHDPKRKGVVNKKRGGIIHFLIQKVKGKNQDDDGFNTDLNGIDVFIIAAKVGEKQVKYGEENTNEENHPAGASATDLRVKKGDKSQRFNHRK